MKILLKRDARIWRKAGETVDVSPAEARHLIAIGSAVQATPSAKGQPKKEKPKK